MSNGSVWTFARLELSESLRSKWAVFTAVLYAAMAAAFVWLGLRESSVLGFTGLSRVLLNIAHSVILVFPLLVLLGTHAAIVRAKTSGFFELMLTQPARRRSWFWGLLLARGVVLLAPLLLVFVCALPAGLYFGFEEGLLGVALRSLAICVSFVFSFLGLGLWVSSVAKTPERALVLALVGWVFTAALHDVLLIGVLLRTSLPPELVFALAALNPSEAARVGILTSVEPELSALGPVGFWLANALGPTLALTVAVLWPASLGVAGVWRAGRNLLRADLVG